MSKRYRITQHAYRDHLKAQPGNSIAVSNDAEVEVHTEGAWVQAYVWVPREEVLFAKLGNGRKLPAKVLSERQKEVQ